jgi:hypothetical protein
MKRTPFNATSGALSGAWKPSVTGSRVKSISTFGTDGVKLGVGGDFHQVSNRNQQGLTQSG